MRTRSLRRTIPSEPKVPKVPSYRLREWVRCVTVWSRGRGHEFVGVAQFTGIPGSAACCKRCGLTIPVTGDVIYSRMRSWVIERKGNIGSSAELKRFVLCLPTCGEVLVFNIHDA